MRAAIIAIASAAILSGCGTITRGSSEDVAINVTPADAAVRLSNGMQCTGSCVVKIARKDSFTVTASAPGYAPQTVAVTTRVSGGGGATMAGNILVGGIIGAGVDAASGASLDHHPNPVVINLERGTRPPAAASRPSRNGSARKAAPTS